jgi:hypothetical protein
MEEYRRPIHRWSGVAALRAIWQEKLGVVKAQQGEECKKTSMQHRTYGEVGL